MLILLKCIVAGYPNRNESLTGRLFSNYGSLNILLHFFRYLIYSVFHETFVKNFMKKLSFFSANFKNPFQDVVYYWKLIFLTLWYWIGGPLKVKSWKICPFWGCFSEIKNADILNFHESNSSVNISHFSQNDIYGSTIVEITGRRRQAFDCKLALQTVQDMVLDSYL